MRPRNRWFLAIFLFLVLATLVLCFGPWLGLRRYKGQSSAFQDQAPYRFPSGFYWGTATAAQQIEDQQPTDWTAFEKEAFAKKRFSHIAKGKPKPGHIVHLGDYNEMIRTRKTDFDRRFAEDIALAAKMKHNAYRFSLDWARLFPTAAHKDPDPAGIRYYQAIFEALRRHKIKPFLTLFHFASPAWLWQPLDGKRGWERKDALEHFERFTRAVLKHFGQETDQWCTLNEPMVYLINGYLEGLFPPNERRGDPSKIIHIAAILLKAHALAYRLIHEDAKARKQRAFVGIAKHTRAFEPYRNYAPLDRITAQILDQAFIWDFLDAIETGTLDSSMTRYRQEIPGLKGTQDYLGINYYGRYYIKTSLFKIGQYTILDHDKSDATEQINDLGWSIYPHGFYKILAKTAQRYKKPIFVLENGTADEKKDDTKRQYLLLSHLKEMWNAIHYAKADIRGYFHWSLFDNFEWAEGFEARFGLIEIDYKKNFQRTPRKSAKLYSEIIEKNAIPASLWTPFVQQYPH